MPRSMFFFKVLFTISEAHRMKANKVPGHFDFGLKKKIGAHWDLYHGS